MDKLIYFPYINVPATEWTIRTLMYYDNISSIVPTQYFYDPKKYYDDHMLELVKSELVIPVDPIRSFEKPWEIVEPFIKYINLSKNDLEERKRNFQSNKVFKIHFDKFVYELFYSLEQIGIAKTDQKNYKWIFVELRTARELLTYLASILSEKLNLGLVTDAIEFRNTTQIELGGSVIDNDIANKREIILKELIPFPSEVNLNKLRKFKDKYNDLLNSFRNKVEQIALNETIKTDSDLLNEKIKELKLRREELSAKMNESQLKNIIFGSVCGVIGAFQGLQSAETSGAIIGAIPGFTAAVYSALKIERPEKIFDQSGMKYLALVDKHLK